MSSPAAVIFLLSVLATVHFPALRGPHHQMSLDASAGVASMDDSDANKCAASASPGHESPKRFAKGLPPLPAWPNLGAMDPQKERKPVLHSDLATLLQKFQDGMSQQVSLALQHLYEQSDARISALEQF